MISGIIIAKNSEKSIAKTIQNLDFCSEVIVVDGGSNDETVEIAQKNNARVIFGDRNDFSIQRNVGLKNAKNEWVFYMDTDELVSDELRKEIIEAVKNKKFNAYFVKRKNYYLGKHVWPKIEKLERLFRKNFLIRWKGKLHESPIIKGKIGLIDGYLLHFTHQNLKEMVNKTILWSDIEAKLRLETNHPKIIWWRFFRVMFTGFFNSFIREKGFLAGTTGVIESIYQSFSLFITYIKLWEMQQQKENQK